MQQPQESKKRRKALITERPLGTIFDVLEEPEPGFVDPDEAAEREAIQWEGMSEDERAKLQLG